MGYHWPVRLESSEDVGWTGVHRPELVDLRPLFEGLAELEDGDRPIDPETWRDRLPDSAHFIRALGPRTAHLYVKAAEVQHLVVSALSPRSGGFAWLTDAMGHSRSHRAYHWAHRLRSFGIETARPLGYLERARSPSRHRSFHVSEHVQAPTLIEFRDEKLRETLEGAEAVLEKRALIERLGRMMALMHRAGLDHSGLRPEGLRVVADGLVLIDLEGLIERGWRQVSVERSLARLDQTFTAMGAVSRADRLRFVDTYIHPAEPRGARRRALLRNVARWVPRSLSTT